MLRPGFLAAAASLALAVSLLVPRPAASAAVPAHLTWAVDLVSTISPANNSYGDPTAIQWKNVDGAVSSNTSVCATFVTTLFKRAYGLADADFTAWFGSTSPYAEVYHAAVVAGNGFSRIQKVADIQAGDLIAIDYRDAGTSTGHVAIASSAPINGTPVTVNGVSLKRYDLWIIDSSKNYHGTQDSRYKFKDGTTPDTGVGEGVMRIFADAVTGEVAGHTWSSANGSTFYAQPDLNGSTGRHLVIGRL